MVRRLAQSGKPERGAKFKMQLETGRRGGATPHIRRRSRSGEL